MPGPGFSYTSTDECAKYRVSASFRQQQANGKDQKLIIRMGLSGDASAWHNSGNFKCRGAEMLCSASNGLGRLPVHSRKHRPGVSTAYLVSA